MLRSVLIILAALMAVTLPAPAAASHARTLCAEETDPAMRVRHCRAAIAAGGSDRALARIHLHLGEAHLALGETLYAIRELRTATRLAPDMPSAHLVLGVAYQAGGNMPRATESFDRAAQIAPEAFEVWYWRARAEERMGLIDDAIRHLGRALEIAPDHPEARLSRARLYCRTGDAPGAAEDLLLAVASGALSEDRLARRLSKRGFGAPTRENLIAWAVAGCP